MASTSGIAHSRSCGPASGWYPSRHTSSAAPWRTTCASPPRTPTTPTSGTPSTPPTPPAQARDFVATMDGQLEAPIDQGGTNVSGGQRQRLAIARAVVKRPLIYLFDDCFSALDATTDARLRAQLSAETRSATVVIVAQRVSTILNADRIIVLDDGAVVGSGTHEQLMVSCDEYREIVVSQLGENAA